MIDKTKTSPDFTTRLNPAALALAFAVAGVVITIAFGAVMGGMGGMMGGSMGGSWMHGSVGGPGYGGSMMGGGLGFLVYALVPVLLGGALAGGVSAWVYNAYCSGTSAITPAPDGKRTPS